MVHLHISTTYPNAIDAIEYCDKERGSGDRNEAGIFTSQWNRSWNESDPIAIGEPNNFNYKISRRENKFTKNYGVPDVTQKDIIKINAWTSVITYNWVLQIR